MVWLWYKYGYGGLCQVVNPDGNGLTPEIPCKGGYPSILSLESLG